MVVSRHTGVPWVRVTASEYGLSRKMIMYCAPTPAKTTGFPMRKPLCMMAFPRSSLPWTRYCVRKSTAISLQHGSRIVSNTPVFTACSAVFAGMVTAFCRYTIAPPCAVTPSRPSGDRVKGAMWLFRLHRSQERIWDAHRLAPSATAPTAKRSRPLSDPGDEVGLVDAIVVVVCNGITVTK